MANDTPVTVKEVKVVGNRAEFTNLFSFTTQELAQYFQEEFAMFGAPSLQNMNGILALIGDKTFRVVNGFGFHKGELLVEAYDTRLIEPRFYSLSKDLQYIIDCHLEDGGNKGHIHYLVYPERVLVLASTSVVSDTPGRIPQNAYATINTVWDLVSRVPQ